MSKEPKMAPIENDYLNNGITDSRHPNFRWNGPSGGPKKLSPEEQIARDQALRDAAPKPLPTFAERQREAQRTGVTVKPSVVVIGKNGTEKLQ